ncbi:MAG TPA: hypothetical protein VFX48_04990, partial [Saprospiraceae bacterium]|nr:hypothetical protein [Saprospiraceae bacterium]
FQGSGMRLYTNLRFRMSPSITLEARFSGTFSLFERNGKTTSTGSYEPPEYDVKLQFQYRF